MQKKKAQKTSEIVALMDLRSVPTRRQVAATRRGDRSLRVYRSATVAATKWGDTSQRQIASCVLENFCENLCLRNRILSLQQVAKNQIRLNLCDLLRRQILLQRQRFSQKLSGTHEATCRCNVSPRHVAATCRLVCTDLYTRWPSTNPFAWLSKKIWFFSFTAPIRKFWNLMLQNNPHPPQKSQRTKSLTPQFVDPNVE